MAQTNTYAPSDFATSYAAAKTEVAGQETRGEKRFRIFVDWGLNYIVNMVLSLAVYDVFKYGNDGNIAKISNKLKISETLGLKTNESGKAFDWFHIKEQKTKKGLKDGLSNIKVLKDNPTALDKIAGTGADFINVCWGGHSLVLPIYLLKRNTPYWVRKFDQWSDKMANDTPSEAELAEREARYALLDTVKQPSFLSIIVDRILGMIMNFLVFTGAELALPKERLDKITKPLQETFPSIARSSEDLELHKQEEKKGGIRYFTEWSAEKVNAGKKGVMGEKTISTFSHKRDEEWIEVFPFELASSFVVAKTMAVLANFRRRIGLEKAQAKMEEAPTMLPSEQIVEAIEDNTQTITNDYSKALAANNRAETTQRQPRPRATDREAMSPRERIEREALEPQAELAIQS